VSGQSAQGEWRSASNGDVPGDAFIGGFENGHPVYVARANFNNGLLPGMLSSRDRKVYVPFYNVAHEVKNYDVLVGSNYRWVEWWFGPMKFPNNAVIGGYSAVNRDTLYICKVKIGKNMDSIGKVHLILIFSV
jgi:hypothetical protein